MALYLCAFGWVIGRSSNKGKIPKSFAYLLEFFNTQINVCLGEQLIIMMDVAVPRTKILTIAFMCSLHAFYHQSITDSLNCYLAATVCLIVFKCIANLVFGSICSLGEASSLNYLLKLLYSSSFVSWLALSLQEEQQYMDCTIKHQSGISEGCQFLGLHLNCLLNGDVNPN